MEKFKDAICLLGMVCVVGLLTLSLVRADEPTESTDGRCLLVAYQHQVSPDSVPEGLLKKSVNNIAGVEILK